jgi:hypothetical protein
LYRIASAVTHTRRTDGVNGFQLVHALAQARGIELVDREGPNTALGASWTADKPRTALPGSFG